MKKEKGLYVCAGIAITIAACMILCLVAMPIVGFGGLMWWAVPRQYITTDLNEYGNYTGNYDNEYPQKFITSFFPNTIEDNFIDIKYEYRAQKNDTYAFEAYLEFKIEDPTEFQAFVAKYIGDDVADFSLDPTFKEYVIADKLELFVPDDETEHLDYGIQYAKIGKILYSEKSQHIICVAIGVYDGGVVTTEFLCNYFNRFNIDPGQYPNAEVR